MSDSEELLIINAHHATEEGVTVAGTLAGSAVDDGDEHAHCNHLTYTLTLFKMTEGVLVRGHLDGSFRAPCDRCLCEHDVDVTTDDVNHYVEIDDDPMIDLTGNIREDILIELPTKWLCAENCRGLCPTCGQNLNTTPCQCHRDQEPDDNVWNKLDDLTL